MGGRKWNGLTQHITQNTAKLQDVSFQTKKKTTYHRIITFSLKLTSNHSILNPCFYYFFFFFSIFKILIIFAYFIHHENFKI
jgi:hypothetical protein